MRLPPFEYLVPDSLEEACTQLAQCGTEARLVAGGSDLLVRMRQRLTTPRKLISLRRIAELDGVRDGGNCLRIGALTRLHDIEVSTSIREKYPALSRAAGKVASYQIRSLATIGGNICLDTRCWYYNQSAWWRQSRSPCFKMGGDSCHVLKNADRCYALFSADMAPALIAMAAQIRLASSFGERTMALQSLYSGVGEPHLALKPEEIIAQIEIPDRPLNSALEYVKFSLSKEVDFPLVGVAVSLQLRNGDCSDARIVISSASSGPVNAVKAGHAIQGKPGRDWSLPEVAEAATREIGPIVHIGATPDYRRQMARSIVEQAIREAIKSAEAANRG